MRIIIGVDNSPHSAYAVDLVRRMSWPADSSVIVLYAVQPIVLAAPEAYVMMAVQAEELLDEERAVGARHVQAVEHDLAGVGLKTEGRVVAGDPREVLVDAARDERADLVVVGSHGRTGLAKLLMGSVASHVVTHAPCSVLVVRRRAEP